MNKFNLSILLIFLSGSVWAQLSPGDLSEAHKQLEGISNCTKCHTIGNKVSNEKCLDCHKEIQSLISLDRGYHVSEEVSSKNCVECHNEHHGRKFDLFRLNEDSFDHDLTTYILEGEHKKIECRDCHKPEYITDSEIRKLGDTYLGMEKDCLSCHDDYHQETLGTDCKKCHDNFEEWDPANLFDHNKADFKLKGAHRDVDCVECHNKSTRDGKDYQQFTELKYQLCTDCHDDEHDGALGENCTDCHTNISWGDLKEGISFDHNLTDYPLTGLHVSVDCKQCHVSGKHTDAIDFTYCKNCHEDYHKEDFTSRNPDADCQDCHTIKSPFTSTLYGLSDHQKSDFILKGSHIATPCFACHVSEDKWSFRDIGVSCVDCHDNIHKDFIDEKYFPEQDCEKCHNSDVWHSVTFDHGTTEWDLEGPHREVTCRECHFKDSDDGTTFTQQFTPINTNCIECHNNEHGNQFDSNGESDCTQCHTVVENWKVKNFDHNETNFPLDGKHIDVDCNECHKTKIFEDNIERVEYKISKFECKDCHS